MKRSIQTAPIPDPQRTKDVTESEYLAHFGLTRPPFSTTPDPSFAYATPGHEDAIELVAFYTEEKLGMFLVQGPIGTGKTTISQLALAKWRKERDKYVVGHIADPSPRGEGAFLRLILDAYNLPTHRYSQVMKDTLHNFLAEQYVAKRTVALVVDEAQTIYPSNFDVLQSISNEQTSTAKLIQIILFAQPNIENKLKQKPGLRSRIAGGAKLNQLTSGEALGLLRYRMQVAGGDFDRVFPEELHKRIYVASGGIPRDLCVLCGACMILAVLRGKQQVDSDMLDQALDNLSFKGWGERE